MPIELTGRTSILRQYITLVIVPKTVDSNDGIIIFGDAEIIFAAAIEFLRLIFTVPSSIP